MKGTDCILLFVFGVFCRLFAFFYLTNNFFFHRYTTTLNASDDLTGSQGGKTVPCVSCLSEQLQTSILLTLHTVHRNDKRGLLKTHKDRLLLY